MSKYLLRIDAIKLRKQGLSYSQINKKLPVSRSTLSLWLRSVQLEPTQIKKINERKLDIIRKKALTTIRNKRINSTIKTINQAWDDTKNLIQNPLFILGTSLYWAEGGKTQEFISFSNSDPFMVKLMLQWLRNFCKVSESRLRAQLHIHSLHSRPHIEKYWSTLTKIPRKQFTKTYIKKTSLGQRKNKLYDGTINIRIHDAELFRKFIGWKLGILEHFKLIQFTKKQRDSFLQHMVRYKQYKTI